MAPLLTAGASVLRKLSTHQPTFRSPKKTSETSAAYFQRAIRSFDIQEDKDGQFIAGFNLSCGHYQKAARRRPPGSRRTSAPCYACGSGTRAPSDKRKPVQDLKAALLEAMRSPDSRDAVANALLSAIEMTTLKPGELGWLRNRDSFRESAARAGLFTDETRCPDEEAA